MARRVEFRHDSNSLLHCVLHYVPGIVGSVGLFRRVGGVLSDFWVRVQDQREGILIDDMPVQHIHLVVHHSIDGLFDKPERKEVAGGVDHQSSVCQRRLVLDHQWQPFKLAVLCSEPSALDGLDEGLQGAYKGDISPRVDGRTFLVDIELVPFLLSGKDALQLGVLKTDFNFIIETDEIGFQGRREHVVGDITMEAFLHLEGDKLTNVLVASFLHLCVEEDLARIADSDIFLPAGYGVGHWEEVHTSAIVRVAAGCQGEHQQH